MKPIRRFPKLQDAPMAVASSGEVLVNITHVLDDVHDPAAAVQQLVLEGHGYFIGIAVPGGLRRELLRGVDDAAADIVGRLGPAIRRRGRR